MSWKLPERLTKQSIDSWPANLKEWTLDYIYTLDPGDDNEHCICSHWIREVCVVKNDHNHNIAKIGNCCIRLFGKHAPSFKGVQTVSDCLKRINQDSSKAPNIGLVQQAFRSRVLNQWEVDFCTETAHKRKLTGKQAEKRSEINHKLLLGICTSAKQALENIREDNTAPANPKLIDKAKEARKIRPQDAAFLKQTWVKPYQVLTEKQQNYRKSLNRKICTLNLV